MEVNCPIGERHFLEIFPLREAEVIYWEGEAGGNIRRQGKTEMGAEGETKASDIT